MLPGVMGTLQATEVIKLLLGVGEPLVGRLLLYDALDLKFREVRIRPDPECELCGEAPTISRIEGRATAEVLPEESQGDREISPQELWQRLQSGPPPVLLDVRERQEWEICRLAGARWAPLSSFDPRALNLAPETEIVLYCYKGKRSLMALDELQRHGFQNLKSLSGGIDRWSLEVDSEVPRY